MSWSDDNELSLGAEAINWNSLKKKKSKLEFQFCVMCPKLFILEEFYFLILESNVRPHHKYSSKWVLSTKTIDSKVNKSEKKKKCFTIINK